MEKIEILLIAIVVIVPVVCMGIIFKKERRNAAEEFKNLLEGKND